MTGTATHHFRQFSRNFTSHFMIHLLSIVTFAASIFNTESRIYFYFSVSQVVEAFSMSPAEFQQKYGVRKPDVRDENLIFHCQSGRRAKKAVESVKELGFDK